MSDILEGNKLIAEFMTKEPEVLKRDLSKAGTLESMQYHESWDWLMPVVEKIAQIRFPGEEHTHETFYPRTFGMLKECKETVFMVRLNRCPLHEAPSLIAATYSAVVEFIKFYNQNK